MELLPFFVAFRILYQLKTTHLDIESIGDTIYVSVSSITFKFLSRKDFDVSFVEVVIFVQCVEYYSSIIESVKNCIFKNQHLIIFGCYFGISNFNIRNTRNI